MRRVGKRGCALAAKRALWRREVLRRARYHFERCGHRTDFLHPHHIWRAGQGGPDELWNGAALCAACHRAVHEDIYIPGWDNWQIRNEAQARLLRDSLDNLL